MEEITQNIAKFNIHALVIIGGFEVGRASQDTHFLPLKVTYAFWPSIDTQTGGKESPEILRTIQG